VSPDKSKYWHLATFYLGILLNFLTRLQNMICCTYFYIQKQFDSGLSNLSFGILATVLAKFPKLGDVLQ
jgi:hypothetical protein